MLYEHMPSTCVCNTIGYLSPSSPAVRAASVSTLTALSSHEPSPAPCGAVLPLSHVVSVSPTPTVAPSSPGP